MIPSADHVESTLPNHHIEVVRASRHDPYGPNWTLVCVSSDAAIGGPKRSGVFHNNPFTERSDSEYHYVRIKGITAPSVAGKYFFKVALMNREALSIHGENRGSLTANAEQKLSFIPIENWPAMLVKGEMSPAIITGTIRHHNIGSRLHGQPIQKPGRVLARMTMRLDNTGKTRPDIPLVDAVGYFNDKAQDHYELHGLAPGVYDLYASAFGFPPWRIRDVDSTGWESGGASSAADR